MAGKPGVVFDTGVVLQAGLRPHGPSGRVVSLIDQDLFVLHVSEECIEEYEDVLTRPKIRAKNPHLTDVLTAAIIERIRNSGILRSELPSHFQYSRDPEDEHVINLAIETGAQFLVSRDNDLLALMGDEEFCRRFPDLTILDPVAFLQELAHRQAAQ